MGEFKIKIKLNDLMIEREVKKAQGRLDFMGVVRDEVRNKVGDESFLLLCFAVFCLLFVELSFIFLACFLLFQKPLL